MSHGHDSHGHGASAGVVVAGEPTPYLADPTKTSTLRCKRRWNDVALLRLDLLAPKTTEGSDSRFKAGDATPYKALRERYLLFVNCVESKPGAEPKHPYLYPQPAVAGAGAH